MIPSQFKYVRAESVQEAISLLQETDGEGKVLAGGHSLVPLMKFRITTPATLVDITRIPNLKDVKVEDRSEEHTSELQSRFDLVCRLLLEKKKKKKNKKIIDKYK